MYLQNFYFSLKILRDAKTIIFFLKLHRNGFAKKSKNLAAENNYVESSK